MTGICNKSGGLVLNPYLSVIHLDEESFIFSLYGKIKRLKGNFTFIRHMRACGRDIPEAIRNTLLRHNILLLQEQDSAETSGKILIFGEGRLAVICREVFLERDFQVELRPFSEFVSDEAHWVETQEAAHHLFCPAEATVAELLEVNRRCLARSLSFTYLFFDSRSFVLGPAVTPGAPCLQCLFTWKYRPVLDNPNASLSMKELSGIQAAFPYLSETTEPALYAANIIASQVAAGAGAEDSLLKRQLKIPASPGLDYASAAFEGISACPVCHGGVSKKHYTEISPFRLEADSTFSLQPVPTVYLESGYRFLETKKAKKMVDSALAAAGSFSVSELRNGPLDEIVPTFVSTLTTPGKTYKGFGKGVSREQAYLSAGFETIERLCSEPYGNLPLLNASWADVKDEALNVPAKISRVFFNRHVDVFNEKSKIDWVWGNSIINGKPLLLPASMVFIGPSRFDGRFYIPSTGGIAAGTSFEDAVLQGLMELVEHDAWMIWQANAATCPRLEAGTVENPEIRRIIRGFEEAGYKVVIRFLATELGIPVFKVWLVNQNSIEVYAAQGLGCHLNKELALLRALTEAKIGMPQKLYQKARNTKYMSCGNRDIMNSRHSLFYLHHFARTEMQEEPPTLGFDKIEDISTQNILGDIDKVTGILGRNIPGLEIAAVNLTQKRLGVPVARVIATGLQQLSQPLQSVQERLFTVPSQLNPDAPVKDYFQLFNGRFQF